MAKCPKCIGPIYKDKAKVRRCKRCGPIYMTAEQYKEGDPDGRVYGLKGREVWRRATPDGLTPSHAARTR